MDKPKDGNSAYVWLPDLDASQSIPDNVTRYVEGQGRHNGVYAYDSLRKGLPALLYKIENPGHLDVLMKRIEAMKSSGPMQTRAIPATAASGVAAKESKVIPAAINYPDELLDQTHPEGAKRQVIVNAYERCAEARDKCIAYYHAVCQVCWLNFIDKYGEIGRDFIHVHHLKPLSEVGGAYRVHPIEDLQPVCPNCHAMLHRTNPPMKIKDLREIVKGIAEARSKIGHTTAPVPITSLTG
jgi:hypothetical protein